MNDLDLERRLTEAFEAKAEQLVPARRTPPPLGLDRPTGERPPASPRTRRFWVGTGLVVTAAAVVVGSLIAVGTDAVSRRGQSVDPADRTSSNPVSATPTGSPTAATTTAPSATGSPTGATSAAAPTTHAVTVGGVTVQVPTSWQAAPPAPNSPFRCLDVGGVAPPDSVLTGRDCDLELAVGGEQTLGRPNADSLGGFGDPGQCVVHTVTADDVDIDGQTAQHRVFTASCFTGTVEQWAVLTTPTVVFARHTTGPADADDTAARAAVTGARLPGPRSALQVSDTGLARAASTSTLTIDRVTVENGGIQNLNPATYEYPLTSATTVFGLQGALSLTQFVDMVRSGDYSAAGITGDALVLLETNGSTVTSIVLLQPS